MAALWRSETLDNESGTKEGIRLDRHGRTKLGIWLVVPLVVCQLRNMRMPWN